MLRSCNRGKQIGVVFSLKLMGESNKIKAMLFLRLVLLKSSWMIITSNFFSSEGSPCKMTTMGRSKELGNKDGGNTLLKHIQTLRDGLINPKNKTYCSVGSMVYLVQKCFKRWVYLMFWTYTSAASSQPFFKIPWIPTLEWPMDWCTWDLEQRKRGQPKLLQATK